MKPRTQTALYYVLVLLTGEITVKEMQIFQAESLRRCSNNNGDLQGETKLLICVVRNRNS